MVELSCCRTVGCVPEVTTLSPGCVTELLSQLRSSTLESGNVGSHPRFADVVGLLSVVGLFTVVSLIVGLFEILVALIVVVLLVVFVAHHSLRHVSGQR